jgi:hypothetical protein
MPSQAVINVLGIIGGVVLAICQAPQVCPPPPQLPPAATRRQPLFSTTSAKPALAGVAARLPLATP